jgi:hypothetical protein
MGKAIPITRLYLLFYVNLMLMKPSLFFKKKMSFSHPALQFIPKIAFFILLIVRCTQAFFKCRYPSPHLEDIAHVYLQVIESMITYWKTNPYTLLIDPYTITHQQQILTFAGFKYPPLQLFIYAPWVRCFDMHGLLMANFFCYLTIMVVIMLIIKKRFSTPWMTYLGGLCFLSTDFLFTLCVNKGINDFYPTLFLLLFTIFLQHKKTLRSTFFLPLLLACSLLSKQLPAGIILFSVIIQRQWTLVFTTIVICFLFLFPYFLSSPSATWDHLVYFHLIRPSRETSWTMFLPSFYASIIQILGIGLIMVLHLKNVQDRFLILRKTPWALPFFSLSFFLLTSKMAPAHYFVWVFPFFLLLLFDLCFHPDFKQIRI